MFGFFQEEFLGIRKNIIWVSFHIPLSSYFRPIHFEPGKVPSEDHARAMVAAVGRQGGLEAAVHALTPADREVVGRLLPASAAAAASGLVERFDIEPYSDFSSK